MNEYVQWEAFISLTKQKIAHKKLEIKHDTESKRAEIRGWNIELKAAEWKKNETYMKLKAKAKNGITGTLSLEDFEPKEIDIDLTVGEYRKAKKEEKD